MGFLHGDVLITTTVRASESRSLLRLTRRNVTRIAEIWPELKAQLLADEKAHNQTNMETD